MANSPNPTDLIPLKHATYQVLLALGDDQLHGYAIMQALTRMTQGRETILPGTLYAALARMADEGLLEKIAAPDTEASGGPKRRYYRRTPFGCDVARAESERLSALLDIAHSQNIVAERSK